MAQDPYRYFRVEARELVDQLGQGLLDLEKNAEDDGIVPQILRLAHTLKGAARVVKQTEIAEGAHAIESLLEPHRNGGRVEVETINAVLAQIDEIAGGVAGLSAPAAAPAAEPVQAAAETPARKPAQKPAQKPDLKPIQTPGLSEDAFRTVRTEVEDVDALLDGVSEAFARLNGLRDNIASVERARHAAELLSNQLSLRGGSGQSSIAAARSDRSRALAEELRLVVGGLERNLGTACDRIGRELQEVRDIAEQLRLIPVGVLFTPLERTARDAAQALGKRVVFASRGGEVRLDGMVLRTVQDALVQMVRNAVAHGIETADARTAAGKPADGHVSVTVERRGRKVVFRCDDDGGGIDVEALRAAAERKGLAAGDPGEPGADRLAELLLESGVSTSGSVTEVAGRGIGMDVVRQAILRLGGDIRLQSEKGKGTAIELVVPLSVAAVDALVVEAGGVSAMIPLDSIRHTQRLDSAEVSHSAEGDTIVYGEGAIPLLPLERGLGNIANGTGEGGRAVVVVAGSAGLAAIGVDRLRGFNNVVVRALPELAPTDAVVSGASLDPEGNPQIVLDADGLVSLALQKSSAENTAEAEAVSVLVIDDSLTTRMLEQSILESAGYRVDLATSGEEGLEMARIGDYALILVDVEMPGMNGFTFVETIRADPALRDIPAILITSLNSPDDLARGEAVGAQGYMIKSEFDQSRLLARIGQLTRRGAKACGHQGL